MKKIDTTLATSTARQPFYARSNRHLQEGIQENDNSISLAMLQSYTTNDVIILNGCLVTVGSPTTIGLCTITAGAVYYNGEIYQCAGFSAVITVGNVIVGTLGTAYQSGDPSLFSDGTLKNVHQIVTFNLTQAGTGTGTKDFSLFKPFLRVDGRTTLATQTNATTAYVDATGLTFTTPNDGKTRKLKIFLNGHFQLTGTHVGGGGEARIYNNTTATELNSGYSFWQLDVGATFAQMRQSFSCEYSGSIAPNSTIKIQFKSLSGAFGIDLVKAVFTYFEY